MAGLVWDGENRDLARITLYVGDRRKTIRLGKVSKAIADKWQDRIGEIVASISSGAGIAPDVAAWIDGLADEGYGRLVKAGLVLPRVSQASRTLGELCDRFKEHSSVKPATEASYAQTLDSLRAFYGEGKPLEDISTESADEWRKWIASNKAGEGKRRKARVAKDNRLSPATVSKRTKVGKQVFRAAVRWGWLPKSPFDGLRAGSTANPSRAHYIDVATTADLLDACPGLEWRIVVALARYAGLRCPSEVGAVRLTDIDWQHGRMTVMASKTEGHGEGHASRLVPICPELRGILAEVFETAEPGATLVAPLASRAGANLRTTFERIILRAGHKPWPRLFQNLRASCETDWVEQYPAHVVAGWLGHSPTIAARHYLQTRDHHFRDVVEGGSERGTKRGTKVAPNTPPQASEASRNVSQAESDSAENHGAFEVFPGNRGASERLSSGTAGTRTQDQRIKSPML